MTKKGIVAVMMAALVVGAASAQVTISGGFALSSVTVSGGGTSMDGELGFGGNIYADYMLPLGVPLSLGAEIGYDTSTLGESGASVTVGAIPILIRAAYHLDLHPQLDLYLVGKIGYALATMSGDLGDVTPKGGVGFGADIGAAFYFTPLVGIFAEAGFDRYMLSAEVDMGSYGTFTIDAPFSRIATFGLSLKF